MPGGRWVQICFLLSLVFSLTIAVETMRHSLPSPKLLGILFLAFLLLASFVVRRSIRRRMSAPDRCFVQTPAAVKNSFVTYASLRGRLFLFSGGIAILLGGLVPRDKAVFLVAGAVTCCFGCYFLLIAKKLRRDAATAAKS